MNFVLKYFVSPAVGAFGLLAGYSYYQNKLKATQSREDGGIASELQQLATKVEDLSLRVTAIETQNLNLEWLDRITSRFISIEERLSGQNDRIRSIDDNYERIGENLEQILRAIQKSGTPMAGQNGDLVHDEHALTMA